MCWLPNKRRLGDHRAVVATAVQRGWNIASLDIAMAFLCGMTFDEIQEIKGGPRREVHLELPKGRPGTEPLGSHVGHHGIAC